MSNCLTPFITKKDEGGIPVPCGKCPNCTTRRTSGWSFRLMQQDKAATEAHFITLTYDTDNIPLTRKGFPSLSKRDIQLFFKRLRKRNVNRRIKYYAVGEYGSKSYRPHYHIILYDCDISTIQNAWAKGYVHYGKLSNASVGYTLKYISKPKRIPQHANDDRAKEFSLMSKGLGKNYLTDNMTAWHKADITKRMYVNVGDGKKAAMPRYYKDKIYDDIERQQAADALRKEVIQKIVDNESNPEYQQKFDKQKLAAFNRQKYLANKQDKL